jgi:hypothetical protein
MLIDLVLLMKIRVELFETYSECDDSDYKPNFSHFSDVWVIEL